MTQTMQGVDWNARRESWRRAIFELADQIEMWCRQRKWLVDRHDSQMDEKHVGTYNAPVLHIHPGTAAGPIVVEPIAADVVGADGRVDIYSIRTFAKLLLIHKQDTWVLYTDAGVQWPQAWSEETFASHVNTLTTP